MKVTITDLAQRRFVVDIDPQASVADLSDALAAQHQVGSRQSSRFILNGKIMQNGDSLVACNIHDGANLVLSIDKKAAATIAALPPAFQAAFSRLPVIRMPLRDEEVHNDECLFSFDNPESPNGIFLPIVPSITRGTATYYAYGAALTLPPYLLGSSFPLLTPFSGAGYVDNHHVRTGCSLYLNIKHTRIEKPKADLAVSKATALAIGTPDGFDVSDNADFTIEKTHTLVCKPGGESLKLSDPNIPATLLPLLNALIEHMSASVSAVSAPSTPSTTAYAYRVLVPIRI
jgi:hypothetical protein